MDFIISFFIFLATYIFSIFYTSIIVLNFLYAIPRAIKDVLNKKLKFKVILAYLIAPIFWTTIIFLSGYSLLLLSENLFYYLTNNIGFIIGDTLGFVTFILSFIFNKRVKYDAGSEYLDFIETYKINK